MAYATEADVSARLGRELTGDEVLQVPALLVEASALVDGHCGRSEPFDPVPVAVGAVVAKMVVRALTSGVTPDGVSTEQQSAGPFQRTWTFAGEGSQMWLGTSEKLMLRPFRVAVVSVATVSDRGAL